MLSRTPDDGRTRPGEDGTDLVDINDNALEVNVINSNRFNPREFASFRLTEKEDGNEEREKLPEFNIVEEQNRDPVLVETRDQLETGKASQATGKRYMLIDETLYFVSRPDDDPVIRLYVPSHLKEYVIKQYHDENGHLGVDKTYDTLFQKYFWPNCYREVHDYVNKCVTCQRRVLRVQKPPLQETDNAPFPFAKINLDISGPYPRSLSGNKYILSFVDQYSGWPEAFATPDKAADTVVQLLIDEIIPRFGCPLQIVTDNGTENENRLMRETLEAFNIDHVLTSVYHPAGNSKVERFHRTMLDAMSKRLDDNLTTWDLHLNQVLAAVRVSVSETTRFSPFFLLYNRDVVLPLDNILKPRRKYLGEEAHQIALENQHKTFTLVQKRMTKAKKRQNKYANKNRKATVFKVGDPVYYKFHQRKSKLQSKWKPYFRITEQKSPVTYIIRDQLDGTTVKAHADHLRLADIDAWEIPKDRLGYPVRKAAYVVPPDSSSDESIDGNDEMVKQGGAMDKVVRRARRERENSSDEDEIPLAELARKLRNQQQDAEADI